MQKVKYTCKNCGWHKEVFGEWADVKPRYCSTPSCELSIKKSKGRMSFRNNPAMLEITFRDLFPTEDKVEQAQTTIVNYVEDLVISKEDSSSGKERNRRSYKAEG